ncbi:MAG: hypothetical protein R3346_01835 [Candidatus Spechtbacterales bacterium]|nr:hypothetical protein [Candidatus Spechtbacterales bacterium]
MLGFLSNIIVIILILTSVFILTLPDNILEEVPSVLKFKNFLKTKFSQSYELSKSILTTSFNSIQEAFMRLRNASTEGYSTTRDTVETKYEAVKDLEDAWNRLTD